MSSPPPPTALGWPLFRLRMHSTIPTTSTPQPTAASPGRNKRDRDSTFGIPSRPRPPNAPEHLADDRVADDFLDEADDRTA